MIYLFIIWGSAHPTVLEDLDQTRVCCMQESLSPHTVSPALEFLYYILILFIAREKVAFSPTIYF